MNENVAFDDVHLEPKINEANCSYLIRDETFNVIKIDDKTVFTFFYRAEI